MATQAQIDQYREMAKSPFNSPDDLRAWGLNNGLSEADMQSTNQTLQQQQLDLQKQQFELQQQKDAAMKAQGLNPDGSPIKQDFQTIANADGTLQSQYTLAPWQNVTGDTSAMDLLKKDALRDAGTDSTWAQLERQKTNLRSQDAQDAASKTNANAVTAAQSQLAQTGGMSGSARERLATNAMRATGDSQASIQRQSLMDMLNIGSQDETNRLNGLNTYQNLADKQTAFNFQNAEDAGKVNQFNLQNQLQELSSKRAWDTNNYNQQMSAWAANKTADAQKQAAGGGGK